MAGQLVGSHPPHVNHWINSYRCAREGTWTVALYRSENHTFWQIRNCYCFLKLVHKKDAENSNLVNNFNWILGAKFCQSLFPLGNTFLDNHSIDLADYCWSLHQVPHKQTTEQNFTWALKYGTKVSFSGCLHLAQAEGLHLLPQTTSAYSIGMSERLDVVVLSIPNSHFFPSCLGTAWRPEQVLTASGHDPFLLWKMSI